LALSAKRADVEREANIDIFRGDVVFMDKIDLNFLIWSRVLS